MNEERSQAKLREEYAKTPVKSKKKRANIKKKLKPRKRGKQRVCFEYEVAKAIARSEGIMSFSQYKRWWRMNTPKRMPKFPQNAYKKEWTGWGDFLGFYNEYTRRPGVVTNGKGKYRSLADARKFVRSLNLRSSDDWRVYTRTGKCPLDIPHRPDVVYSTGKRKEYWLSWKDFLGSGKQALVVSLEDKHDDVQPVLYIAKKPTGAHNIYIINVIPGGKPALIDHLLKVDWLLISAFYTSNAFNHMAIIKSLSTYGSGEVDEYVISNIYDIISELEYALERVR